MAIDYEVLTQLQEDAVEEMAGPDAEGAALLAFDPGMGKTRTAVMLADRLDERVILVVLPLSTIDSWTREFHELSPKMQVRQINSTKGGQKVFADFQWRKHGVYLIGHTMWERMAWTRETYKTKRRIKDVDPKSETFGQMVPEYKHRKVASTAWSGDGFMFVYDESHLACNWQAWSNKALMNLDPRVYKLSLSGTPFGDQFEGAYGATRWLWPHRTDIIPKNPYDWRHMWAETKYDKFAPRNEKVVGEKDPGAFTAALPCYIRAESDLPDAIPHELWVDLYPEQRRVYDELDDKMVAWIKDHPLVTTLSITRRARQRQMALAMPDVEWNDETGEATVSFAEDAESSKIDRLIRALEGNDPELADLLLGESLLILTDSQQFARLLTKRLNDRFGDVAREWSGKVTRVGERDQIKQLFLDRKIKYIVGVIAAMGTGTDGLQAVCRIGVMMSRSDWRISNTQGIARWNRTGQEEEAHLVSIFARDTRDSGQNSKQVDDALKMNRILLRRAREEERRGNATE